MRVAGFLIAVCTAGALFALWRVSVPPPEAPMAARAPSEVAPPPLIDVAPSELNRAGVRTPRARVAAPLITPPRMDAPAARPSPPPPEPTLDERLAELGLRPGLPVFMRIFKEERLLELWMQGDQLEYVHVKSYPICAYSGGLGPKLKEGDRQSPEGFYFVTPAALNPNSSYHLSFNLGFPNAFDRSHGRTGSFLMVHGECVSIGCYAMTNPGIEEIYGLGAKALGAGQAFFRVHAFPFRMTEANMARHAGSKWIDFWRNLREGYDAFEQTRVPPNITAAQRRYVVDGS